MRLWESARKRGGCYYGMDALGNRASACGLGVMMALACSGKTYANAVDAILVLACIPTQKRNAWWPA